MARTYSRLMLSVWRDDDFLELAGGAQRLYFLLISQPALSHAGCLPLQPSKWAKLAKNTTVETVTKALDELDATRFVLVDPDAEEVLVRSFIKHDGGARNPNLAKAISSAIDKIDSARLRQAARTEFDRAKKNPQVTDPGQDRPQDPLADRRQGDAEGHPEPTYILHPSSLSLHPSTSAADQVSTAPATADRLKGLTGRKRDTVERCGQIAWDGANQSSIRSKTAFVNAVHDRVLADPELDRYLNEYPTAAATEIAAWLNGEKNTIRYHDRRAS